MGAVVTPGASNTEFQKELRIELGFWPESEAARMQRELGTKIGAMGGTKEMRIRILKWNVISNTFYVKF